MLLQRRYNSLDLDSLLSSNQHGGYYPVRDRRGQVFLYEYRGLIGLMIRKEWEEQVGEEQVEEEQVEDDHIPARGDRRPHLRPPVLPDLLRPCAGRSLSVREVLQARKRGLVVLPGLVGVRHWPVEAPPLSMSILRSTPMLGLTVPVMVLIGQVVTLGR